MKYPAENRAMWRMCLGCGACIERHRSHGRSLFDMPNEGIRSVNAKHAGDPAGCCDDGCPLVETDFQIGDPGPKAIASLRPEWGPILEIWEGHAANPAIRFRGASGGVLTALCAYAIEKMGMEGVLHTGQDPEDPIKNRTRLSRNLEELLSAAGSRYSPASVCNGLHLVAAAGGKCVFVGKPVEVAALRNLERVSPEWVRNVGLVLSFFCAETPSTRGTLELLSQMGVDPDRIDGLRYRGCGWPGDFTPYSNTASAALPRMTYRESWAFLQAYRPWSAQVWPDGTGELADISCGDPWYREPDGENPGSSIVVVRTERGRRILHDAMRANYLQLEVAEPWKLTKSQEGLIKKKGAIWGRLMIMRLFGLPTPNYKNAHLFQCWLKLSFKDKLRSTLGTARRIILRKLYRPMKVDLDTAAPVKDAMVGCVGTEYQSRKIKAKAGLKD
jgi:coenzyme F420 hydrogenase subunit beta